MTTATIGIDVGTSSSKGVLVDSKGAILATAVREHEVLRPHPGWVEMSADIWFDEFVSICRELIASGPAEVVAVGVSGMGPCVAVADAGFRMLRPAILYGVDSRARDQIVRLTAALGNGAIVERCGSALSTQAVGPKLAWLADEEPRVFERARYLFMPASWLVWNLTGNYVLDHHSASQCTPLYDNVAQEWYVPWASAIAGEIELPRLLWSGDVAGEVTPAASELTGLPAGIPVIAGTIDAWSEAISVGAHGVGDLMLMYGTTMFLVSTVAERLTAPNLWATVGVFPGTHNLAAGMATSGAITSWLRGLFGADYGTLIAEAAASGVGARGLLMLPYFAGERTPLADPDARGVIAGLTIQHTRGDLYRAALEATAMGVRHNVEALRAAGADIGRVVAVGGGTQGELWPQIVSDATGIPQEVRAVSIGASFGAAFLAAGLLGEASIDEWNPVASIVAPRARYRRPYDEQYELYRELYPAIATISHALAARQRAATSSTSSSALSREAAPPDRERARSRR